VGQFLFEYEVLLNHVDLDANYPFWTYLTYDVLRALAAALVGGYIMVFFLEHRGLPLESGVFQELFPVAHHFLHQYSRPFGE